MRNFIVFVIVFIWAGGWFFSQNFLCRMLKFVFNIFSFMMALALTLFIWWFRFSFKSNTIPKNLFQHILFFRFLCIRFRWYIFLSLREKNIVTVGFFGWTFEERRFQFFFSVTLLFLMLHWLFAQCIFLLKPIFISSLMTILLHSTSYADSRSMKIELLLLFFANAVITSDSKNERLSKVDRFLRKPVWLVGMRFLFSSCQLRTLQ